MLLVRLLVYMMGRSRDENTSALQARQYVGQKRSGLPHGFGTLFYNDGARYSGEWLDGKVHGKGELILPDGLKYIGQLRNNTFHGRGP